MREYVALRRSITRDGYEHLPRPKIVQEVLLIGSKENCQSLIDELATQPMHQSTDEVLVDLLVTVYNDHKSHNSQEIRKDNGKRFKK
jgi:pyrimidine operon attenuation protein/uracil phosphoribosyltransferase